MVSEKKKTVWKFIVCAVLVLGTGIGWGFISGTNAPGMADPAWEEDFPVRIKSCLIDSKTGGIRISAYAGEFPDSDDIYYYLFALETYEEEIPAGQAYLLRGRKETELEFNLEFIPDPALEVYNETAQEPETGTGIMPQSEEGLFHKYVVAVKREGQYIAVSRPHYITNPEALAVFVSNGERPEGKKGLLIDPEKLLGPELEELGVKHAAYNIPVSRILGHDEEDAYEAVRYFYRGKEYIFNGRVMSEYDLVFRTLTEKGIEITAIILNDVSEDYPWLIHPLARSGIGKPPYYAFNASDGQGSEYLAAIGSFLAERYSGVMNGRGVVSNWVIGNEINARKEWNYMEYTDLDVYVREYARAYRIFYNAIKSINSACRVYISLDNQWGRVNILTRSYKARDVLEEFNRQIREEGNIDWGLAIHPYNKPLAKCDTWKGSFYVRDRADTPVVSMANIHVVTDYMRQEGFLTDAGEVRPITLSELGYSSSKGEKEQAAAIVYAYKMAEANPYIDAVLFSRQTDAEAETEKLKLYLGLDHPDGTHKYAYYVYKYMDTEEADSYTGFAKDMIGIGDWPEVTGKKEEINGRAGKKETGSIQ